MKSFLCGYVYFCLYFNHLRHLLPCGATVKCLGCSERCRHLNHCCDFSQPRAMAVGNLDD